MAPPARSQERDEALLALLHADPFPGWNIPALGRLLEEQGGVFEDAALLFPGGTADLLEAFADWADRRMEEAAQGAALAGMRTTARVRSLIALRLHELRLYKEPVRRALGQLALPRFLPVALRCEARTVDAIWHLAGDRSVDFSWYTKRLLLAGVYMSTLLYWLRDPSEDNAATLAFLDRRLADVGRIGRLRGRPPKAGHRKPE